MQASDVAGNVAEMLRTAHLTGVPRSVPGLKRNGFDHRWAHERKSECTEVENLLNVLSRNLRHQLKLERKARLAKAQQLLEAQGA